jgi:hypothetical protein
MALSIGTTLGPYEILAAIGAGGMGEVYRARDTKLGRDVAIKVLPREFWVGDKDPLRKGWLDHCTLTGSGVCYRRAGKSKRNSG